MNIFTSGLVLALCFLSASSTFFPFLKPIRFKSIVIFGDSLSDNGNAFELTHKTWPIPSAYYKGRFSNGPNWVDQLEVLGIQNYAYGSATTDNNVVQGYTKSYTVPVPGMRQQIDIYLSRNPVKRIDFSRTLYIFFGGGNDFIFNNTLLPPTIVASLLNGPKYLLSLGAQHIMVFDQPPVQKFPYTRSYNNEALFTQLTAAANFALTSYLKPIQASYPQASLNIFNINKLITQVTNKTTTYFTNITDRCWVAVNTTTVLKLCPDPETYVFVDDFHLTTRVHGLIANALRPFFDYSYEVNNGNCYIQAVKNL